MKNPNDLLRKVDKKLDEVLPNLPNIPKPSEILPCHPSEGPPIPKFVHYKIGGKWVRWKRK